MSCKNVLVVEDDRAIRQMIKDVLEVEGYTVFTAADGREGIEQLKSLSPSPCMVVLDLMMPGTNGWKFLDHQRSDPKLSAIPIIVCSAYSESAKSVKPNAILEKPVKLDALLHAVHEFCA